MNLKTILESLRQVKEQERYDTAIDDLEVEAEALFQLSEHEQQTLTDEAILAKLEIVLQKEEELKEKQEQAQEELQLQQQEAAPSKQLVGTDWLRNRRAVLLEGSGHGGIRNKGSDTKHQQQVPVIHHMMLKSDEIKFLLKINGGRDIKMILDDPDAQRMGGSGTLGMIFCTGSGGRGTDTAANHPYLIYTLSRALIDHMKDRKLQDIGITGANQNTTNNTTPLHQPQSSSSSSEWMIVDCGNYIVHILDASKRKQLQLEKLWSGKDELWKVNMYDDDSIEDYCYRNPVPDMYGSGSRGGREDGGEDFDSNIARRLVNQSIYGSGRPKHQLAVSQSQRNRDRIHTNKRKREQRELDHRGK